MKIKSVNDFVIKFANVNGSGSASANQMFAKGVFRSGIPVSPKNIFLRQSSAIILDAECATMGDPVFDLAFCLNHLILKALHLPQHKEAYLQFVEVFWQGYASHICWENREDLGERLMHLLPALMLARIDGKSPVEYLDEATRAQVRALSRHFLQQPSQSLLEMIAKLKK